MSISNGLKNNNPKKTMKLTNKIKALVAMSIMALTVTLFAATYTYPPGLNGEQQSLWQTILDSKPASAGTETISGTWAFTGANTHTGLETGMRRTASLSTNVSVSVSSGQSSTVFVNMRGSTTQTLTLPAAATGGMVFTFIADSAASETLINGVTGDIFSIKATGDAGASVVTAPSTGIKNTAATNVKGDNITLISDGGTNWYGFAQSGIWASQ